MRYRRGEDDPTSSEGHTETKLKDWATGDVHGGSLRLNARKIHRRAQQIDYLPRKQSDFAARSTRRSASSVSSDGSSRLTLALERRIGTGPTMIRCHPDYSRERQLPGVPGSAAAHHQTEAG
jgi:hypothetical protein